MKTLTLTKPDDWHLHLRDGDALKDTLKASQAHFKRALIMPNLVPPVTTIDRLTAYQTKINALKSANFNPYFSLYLTDETSIELLQQAKNHPAVLGFKLYPQGATTHSDAGVSQISTLYPCFEAMQQLGLTLQVHGETTKGDIFAREASFIQETLKPIIANFPKLRIVLEHISTKEAVDFVNMNAENVAATITIHHLLYNRNHLLAKGIKPHFYCLPILKSEKHQKAIQQAAISGSPKFFLGTDSAPHASHHKESACGCAGIFSAPYALSLYAEFFEQMECLDKLEAFASFYGADFYHLARNQEKITLIKKPLKTQDCLKLGPDKVIPIAAGQTLAWSVYP